MSNPTICVAGGGSWGTALAHLLAANGYDTCLWLRDAAVAQAVTARHENPRYLPGFALHPSLSASTAPSVLGRDIVVLAVPCQQLRGWLAANAEHFCNKVILVNAAKGIETANLVTCAEIAQQSLGHLQPRYAVLSGPSFAADVLRGLPTAVVLASADEALGHSLRQIFSSASFRCYSSTDVMGVEMGGAVKNVMAIAAGLCDGLALGLNARAALLTRGLAEMTRLGVALGAKVETFMGLSGMGDLLLTATGDLSRNRKVGLLLAQGLSQEAAVQSLGHVAEGVYSARTVVQRAQALGVEMPIATAVVQLLDGTASPQQVLHALMGRDPKGEYV